MLTPLECLSSSGRITVVVTVHLESCKILGLIIIAHN